MRQADINDAYAALGIPQTSSLEEVKNAYKRLALQFHPDKNPSPDATERFQEIGTAYNRVVKHLEDPAGGDYFDEVDGEEMDLEFFLFMFARMSNIRRERRGPFMSNPSSSLDEERRRKDEEIRRAASFAERKARRLEEQLEAKRQELAKRQQQQREEARLASQKLENKQRKKEDRAKARQEQQDIVRENKRASQQRRSDVFEMARQGDTKGVKAGIWEQNVDAAGPECLVGMEEDPTYLEHAQGCVNDSKETLLHIFARSGDLDMIKWLLDYSADVEERDSHDRTPFHISLQHAHVHIISFFIQTFPANSEEANKIFKAPQTPTQSIGQYSLLRLAFDSVSPIAVEVVLANRLIERSQLEDAWQFLKGIGWNGPGKGFGDEWVDRIDITQDEQLKNAWVSIREIVMKAGNFERPSSPHHKTLPTPISSPPRASEHLTHPKGSAEPGTHVPTAQDQRKKKSKKTKKKPVNANTTPAPKESDPSKTLDTPFQNELNVSFNGPSIEVSIKIHQQPNPSPILEKDNDTSERRTQDPEDSYPSPISGYPSSPEVKTGNERFRPYSDSSPVNRGPNQWQYRTQNSYHRPSLSFSDNKSYQSTRTNPSGGTGPKRIAKETKPKPSLTHGAATETTISSDPSFGSGHPYPGSNDGTHESTRGRPIHQRKRRGGRGHAQADDGNGARATGPRGQYGKDGGSSAHGQNDGPKSGRGGGEGVYGQPSRGRQPTRGGQRGRGGAA